MSTFYYEQIAYEIVKDKVKLLKILTKKSRNRDSTLGDIQILNKWDEVGFTDGF